MRVVVRSGLALAFCLGFGANATAQFSASDACETARNNVCEEPVIGSGSCPIGTDTTDCRGGAMTVWSAVLGDDDAGYSAIHIYGPKQIPIDQSTKIVIRLEAKYPGRFVNLLRGMLYLAVPETVDVDYSDIVVRYPDFIEQGWITFDPTEAKATWFDHWAAKVGLDVAGLLSSSFGTAVGALNVINDRFVEQRLDLADVTNPFSEENRYDYAPVAWEFSSIYGTSIAEIVIGLRFTDRFDAKSEKLAACRLCGERIQGPRRPCVQDAQLHLAGYPRGDRR